MVISKAGNCHVERSETSQSFFKQDSSPDLRRD